MFFALNLLLGAFLRVFLFILALFPEFLHSRLVRPVLRLADPLVHQLLLFHVYFALDFLARGRRLHEQLANLLIVVDLHALGRAAALDLLSALLLLCIWLLRLLLLGRRHLRVLCFNYLPLLVSLTSSFDLYHFVFIIFLIFFFNALESFLEQTIVKELHRHLNVTSFNHLAKSELGVRSGQSDESFECSDSDGHGDFGVIVEGLRPERGVELGGVLDAIEVQLW